MKKKAVLKVVLIGILHSILYLWLIPFIIFPKFGHSGFLMAVMIAVLISVGVLGSIFVGKRERDRSAVEKEYREK